MLGGSASMLPRARTAFASSRRRFVSSKGTRNKLGNAIKFTKG